MRNYSYELADEGKDNSLCINAASRRNIDGAVKGIFRTIHSELYIHGRLTPAQKVKPNMAEFEAILVRHPQSSTCTAVRQYI